MNERRCPALIISAPRSGEGKTTVTAALARRYRDRGLRVRVFKTGPDFLDPMILERASGHPVYQLDLWMGGEAHCRHLLHEAAATADLILIEGVMGLFDGTPCTADLAARLNIPVLAIIDASAMAQTFGAVAFGLAHFRHDITIGGLFANRIGGERHAAMLASALPDQMELMGWLAREADFALPDRHLGLVQAAEVLDLDTRLSRAAAAMQWRDEIVQPVRFMPSMEQPVQPLLAGVRIAVARDMAFSFLYQANLDTLRALGAELRFFSPLNDAALPEADSLYLPGGYPELHLGALADNRQMMDAIRAHHRANKPILAECGGMLYVAETLTDAQGATAPMVGLLPGHAVMQKRLAALGLQGVLLPEGELRGHTFHHSRFETTVVPIAHSSAPEGHRGEAIYRIGKLTASYMHLYFPSNPQASARLFLP